jgi:hypothetical protein
VREAVAPSRTNGCYGWLIWVNAGKPCIGVTIQDRPVSETRDMPALPADMYRFSGLFGQLVTVFPSQGIVVVRTGQDPGLVNFSGGTGWEQQLYEKVLASVTDQTVEKPGDAPDSPGAERTNADYGFQTAIQEPDRFQQGANPDPLPPAGPKRARAAQLGLIRATVGRTGVVAVRVSCPPRGGTEGCAGRARLDGARKRFAYSIPAGSSRTLRFKLGTKQRRQLRRGRELNLAAVALNRADGGSTITRRSFTVRRAGA